MIEEKRVLALKYRPKRFEDLIGQSTISQTLSLALDSNRLSHAYLFSGLRGSGKTSTARIMAKALLCSQGPTSKPCDVCENCQSANTNRHLDIIEMDAASNRGIDDIKDLIEHTKYKPSSARFKVFIIDEVHMLTPQAFNALLKTLEEPPGFVKFILATTDPLKLPATILSRTQHFRFKKISQKDVIHHLSHILHEENIEFETEALEVLSRSGQGSLRDTLTLMDQAIIFSKGRITTSSVTDMLGLIDPKFMDNIFQTVLTKGDINPIISALEEYEAGQICDEITIYLKQKMLERDPKFDVLLYDRFFRIVADAKHLLSLNSDSGFVLILMLSKMIEATNLKSIEEIINEVENVEVKETPIKEVQVKTDVAPTTQSVQNEVTVSAPVQPVQTAESEAVVEQPQEAKPTLTEPEPIKTVEPVQTAVAQEPESMPTMPEPNPVVQETVEQEVPAPSQPAPQVVEPQVQPEPSVPYPTPFDEYSDETPFDSNNSFDDVSAQEETSYEPSPAIADIPLGDIISEPEKPMDPYEQKYEELIDKIFDRSYDLGVVFEKNFEYTSFENDILHITSYAVDEERKMLYSNFALIRTFVADVFGVNTQMEFSKGDVEKKDETPTAQEQDASSAGSMLEDIELNGAESTSAGCVADMTKSSQPKPAEQEIQIQDVLDSPMVNRAKELFDIKRITIRTKT
ncbi:DNA polymerase III subunit gamma/tau [Candidatus Marinarcus aquaticus]|uniref:DNA polymerase III subunit gamma/tau n=1 Tax=Candidatus Marinarcus aquaticus TaxID=2044504 RepID=A0A4Q0XPB7_9BACT|nr:DNA polymerase III subunit gamma/tau [Candidatus Marinarcus aquaticus]RXJ56460.1 DNA polymerase III subunit gamma/tau [Candidatus Marinarcus aquaticus]